MKWLVVSILIGFSVKASAQTSFSKIGQFSDVESDDEGEHCLGTSIELWKISDSNLIGMIDIHEGLCGDPPCSFIKGKITNNRLEVSATDSIWDELYSFKGQIKKGHLKGILNSKPIDLKIEKDGHSRNWDKDITSWCERWSKVHRCKGIMEYCKDLPKKNN